MSRQLFGLMFTYGLRHGGLYLQLLGDQAISLKLFRHSFEEINPWLFLRYQAPP
jgi:hypothetical protein